MYSSEEIGKVVEDARKKGEEISNNSDRAAFLLLEATVMSLLKISVSLSKIEGRLSNGLPIRQN